MFVTRTSRFPLADLQVATHSLNRLFDEALRGWPEANLAGSWTPPVDVIEDTNEVRLMAELPGVKPEDVKISLENNVLTLHGEKLSPMAGEQNGDRSHRVERTYGTFDRSFTVPSTVDADRIEARYEHGILTIRLPKAEKARPRQITVQVQA